jgi:hypothetical protein
VTWDTFQSTFSVVTLGLMNKSWLLLWGTDRLEADMLA